MRMKSGTTSRMKPTTESDNSGHVANKWWHFSKLAVGSGAAVEIVAVVEKGAATVEEEFPVVPLSSLKGSILLISPVTLEEAVSWITFLSICTIRSVKESANTVSSST